MPRLAFEIGHEFWSKQYSNAVGEWILLKPEYQTFGAFINAVLPNIYILASIIFFLLLIAGGLMFIVGAGSQKEENIETSKKLITGALIGFLIIFGSYWLMQIVGKVTGVDILSGPD